MKLIQIGPILLTVLLGCVACTYEPYPVGSDPRADIADALQSIEGTEKRVLLVFGGNWCPDCRALDEAFRQHGPTEALINTNFAVVKIDIGNWDVNMDVAAEYQDAASNGIPSIVVLNGNGDLLHITKAKELASAFKMSRDDIYNWFVQLLSNLNA